MLKLPKGLKKKKKKSKKDQELFTEEELEQYKQKLKQQQQDEGEAPETSSEQSKQINQEENKSPDNCSQSYAAANTSVEVPTNNKPSEEDEEWKRFKLLTAGVDSILHKTQDELHRIKESSFYQKQPTAVEKQKQDEEDARRKAVEERLRKEEEEKRRKELEEANRDKLAEAVVELSESEEESEEVDDIFSTDYIDAIASGEVQLAIVLDSPVLDEGPDPFDTTAADKIIKGPEISSRGKKIVSLGSAVQVLTGRVDSAHAVKASGAKKKPRRGIQNLLLDESIDEDSLYAFETEIPVTPEPTRFLLDELEDEIPSGPIDLSAHLCLDLLKQQNPRKTGGEENDEFGEGEDLFDTSIFGLGLLKNKEEEHKSSITDDILSEFDVLNKEDDDEFAELAFESLSKKEEITKLHHITAPPLLASAVEFEVAFEKPKPSRPPPPTRPPPPVKPEGYIDIDDEDLDGADPFDTAYVEQLVPKKDEDDDFDFDPRAGEEEVEKTVITRLYSNTEEKQKEESLEEDIDPFDTSTVSNLVQSKASEKASSKTLNRTLSDIDFDPRAGEPETKFNTVSPVVLPEEFDTARRKSSLSLNIQSKSVGFLVPDNSLGVEANKIQKPLTPYYAPPQSISEKETEDPFDTSFVKAAPTDIELKHLERDLLVSTNLNHSISDPDFDPRAAEAKPTAEDLLSANDNINIKVLTPKHEAKIIIEENLEEDPFDTSIASACNIQPGATELKLLENELLPAKTPEHTGVLDTLTDAQELGLGDKVLTPQIPTTSFDIEERDPFDTSIAENLGPGKTEIKILESEFVD